jgi:ubiquinone/menaquinone biosynthesis C-methylase UbiE/ADP-ribose pyrophosphatase YjhB (NUDIX family)
MTKLLKDIKRFKLKAGVFLVLIQNNQVLLSRRYNTGIADGQHVLPMGGLEEGETLTQAIIREAKEEVNLTLQPETLQVVHLMHRLHHLPNGDSFPQIDVFFSTQAYEGTPPQNMEPHKCDEVKFYPLNDLPSTLEPFIQQALRCIQKKQFYSEIGWLNEKLLQEIEQPGLTDQVKEVFSPQIYETTAKTYDQHRKADPGLLEKIENHLPSSKKGRYLDIGCGSGNYTTALFNRGFDIEGIDISVSMLDKARSKAPHQRWAHGDMQSLPFSSGLFNGVVTMNTLHYVKNTLVPVFQEMKRVLKPEGHLVIYVISLEQCLQFWLGHYFPFFRDVGYKALLPIEKIIASLKESGFSAVHTEPFFVTEHTSDLFTYACKYRPHLFLDPTIRAGMTPLQLPEYAEEVRIGCDHLKRDIASGAIYRVISQHESRLGEGFLISAKA